MKWLIVVVVLLVAGVVGVAFYQGWLNVSTAGADLHPSVTVNVDENKYPGGQEKTGKPL